MSSGVQESICSRLHVCTTNVMSQYAWGKLHDAFLTIGAGRYGGVLFVEDV